MSGTNLKRILTKRLLPLYVAGFFQSFVLWYAIEKVFMKSIGFNNTQIGLMIAVYSAVMLVVETPSGILADRWSRKGVLILASISLSISAMVGGLSHNIGVYLVAAIFWGIFFACYSGLYDSIIYDCIAEVGGDSKLFDFLYGRSELADSIGLVLGGILGAFIATITSLRAVYFVAAPIALFGVIALLIFKEPTFHKKQVALTMAQQIKAVFKAILKNRSLVPVVIVLIVRATLIYILFEFAQLWLIALNTPVKYYGIAYGVLFSSLGIGGILVNRLKLSRYIPTLILLLVIFLSCIGLIVFRSTTFIVVSQLILASGLMCLYIVFSRLLHDNLSSSIRAGAASATSTIGRFFIIPLALLFGYISQKWTIYKAGYLLLILIALMSLFVIVVTKRDTQTKDQNTIPLTDLEK